MSNAITHTATAIANQNAYRIAGRVSNVVLLDTAPEMVAGPDGSMNVYLTVLGGLEVIAAHVNPQGRMTDLQSAVRNTRNGKIVQVTDLAKSDDDIEKSELWMKLKMDEVIED